MDSPVTLPLIHSQANVTANFGDHSSLHGSSRPENTSLHFLIHDIWEAGGDPRVSQFALMRGGPWPVLAIICFYLLFVKKIGPKLMENREPFNLRWLILAYNMIMMCLNFYFFYSAAIYTDYGLKAWGSCIKINPSDFDATMQLKLTIIWYFFISKFIDLLETVFFVLRKKYSQASFLHIFHHSIVPIDVWVGFKYSPSESACFFPFINSFVHTIMYFYYGLSTLGPRVSSARFAPSKCNRNFLLSSRRFDPSCGGRST